MFYLSQAHLQKFQRCPPSFQQAYLEQLGTPLDPQQQQKQEWGVRFHLAMQQLHNGLTLKQITAEPKLQTSVQSLLQEIPYFLKAGGDRLSKAEYRQTLFWEAGKEEFLLTIICDWIVFGPETLEIHDWKTYRQPEKTAHLQDHWQTKLYLYLMAIKSDYPPEQLSMTYWFVEADVNSKPQSVTFQYSTAWHKQIEAELTVLLTKLAINLANYFDQQQPFDHDPPGTCRYCPNERQRQKQRRSPNNALPSEQDLDRLLAQTDMIEI